MCREDPWTMRYTTWPKGEWEDLEQSDFSGWMQYFGLNHSYRLRRVSLSWMVFDYIGGAFKEDQFHLIFHRRF